MLETNSPVSSYKKKSVWTIKLLILWGNTFISLKLFYLNFNGISFPPKITPYHFLRHEHFSLDK